ncbi:MAG: hypothetical protein QM820_25895 [Minicystis sp.]
MAADQDLARDALVAPSQPESDLEAPVAPAPPSLWGSLSSLGFSLTLHTALLVISAFAMPTLAESAPITETEHWAYILSTIAVAVPAGPEEDEPQARTVNDDDPDGEERVDSRCGEKRGGMSGAPDSEIANHRYGVSGPPDNPDPHLGRDRAAGSSWMYFTFMPPRPDESPWHDPDAPVMPWGRDDSLGTDPTSARGGLWGAEYGNAPGAAGVAIGLPRLCPTCGATGRGVRRLDRTFEGGPTDTEAALSFAVTHRD